LRGARLAREAGARGRRRQVRACGERCWDRGQGTELGQSAGLGPEMGDRAETECGTGTGDTAGDRAGTGNWGRSASLGSGIGHRAGTESGAGTRDRAGTWDWGQSWDRARHWDLGRTGVRDVCGGSAQGLGSCGPARTWPCQVCARISARKCLRVLLACAVCAPSVPVPLGNWDLGHLADIVPRACLLQAVLMSWKSQVRLGTTGILHRGAGALHCVQTPPPTITPNCIVLPET
jgi:hypothetical protein